MDSDISRYVISSDNRSYGLDYVRVAKITIIGLVILIIIVIVYKLTIICGNNFPDEGTIPQNFKAKLDNLPDPLTKCGWILYAAEWCGYCKMQIELLNKLYPGFTSTEGNVVYGQTMKAYPTWYNVNTKETIMGYQDEEKLQNMVFNCGLNKVSNFFDRYQLDEEVNTDFIYDPLTESGWVLYTAEWCGYCDKQLEILNELFPGFIDIDGNVIYGQPAQVYPTWKNRFTNQEVLGLQDKNGLHSMIIRNNNSNTNKSNYTNGSNNSDTPHVLPMGPPPVPMGTPPVSHMVQQPTLYAGHPPVLSQPPVPPMVQQPNPHAGQQPVPPMVQQPNPHTGQPPVLPMVQQPNPHTGQPPVPPSNLPSYISTDSNGTITIHQPGGNNVLPTTVIIPNNPNDMVKSQLTTSPSDPLTQAGWVLYAAEWCGYCKKQIELLNSLYPSFVSTDGNVVYGQPAQVYPTWKNKLTGQELLGYQDENGLTKMVNKSTFSNTPKSNTQSNTNGWVLYAAEWCGYCKMQIELLNKLYPGFVDTDGNVLYGKPAKVYPTWKNTITGEEVLGFLDEEKLKTMLNIPTKDDSDNIFDLSNKFNGNR